MEQNGAMFRLHNILLFLNFKTNMSMRTKVTFQISIIFVSHTFHRIQFGMDLTISLNKKFRNRFGVEIFSFLKTIK